MLQYNTSRRPAENNGFFLENHKRKLQNAVYFYFGTI